MSANQAMAYMQVTGSQQGTFLEDQFGAGDNRTLCLSVRFRGEVPHDVRGGKYATTRHEPVAVVHEWGPATVQFLSALWSNETLSTVTFEFVRTTDAGEVEVYAHLTLTSATVAHVELRSGDTEKLAAGAQRVLGEVGLHAAKIEFKLKGPQGPMVASYDRARQS